MNIPMRRPLLLAVAALGVTAAPAYAGTGACGARFIEPTTASYAAASADDGTMISSGNATGPAAGWAAASLLVNLPLLGAITTPWTICGLTDNNTALVFNAPLLSPPATPSLSSTTGGVIGSTTYYVKITYTDTAGETLASSEASLAVAANHLLVITTPGAAGNATGYNVYVATNTGAETKQNSSPIALSSNWTEPTGGLVVGAALPSFGTAPAAYILDGGQSIASYVVGTGNYQSATLVSDGANYRVMSTSLESRRINGATSSLPSRPVYPAGPGYAATLGDSGNIIYTDGTSAGLAVTLPSTNTVTTNWVVSFAATTMPGSITVNGTSGGSLIYDDATTASTYSFPIGTFFTVQFDGANFRVHKANTLALNPVGQALGLNIVQLPTGSTTGLALNLIDAANDQLVAPESSTTTSILQVLDVISSSTATGGRNAGTFDFILAAPSGNASPGTQIYSGIEAAAIMKSNDGGTAISPRGNIIGIGGSAVLSGVTSAAHIYAMEGFESDTILCAACSAVYEAAYAAVSNDAAHGTTHVAYNVSGITGTVGFNIGLGFTNNNSAFGIASGGKGIAVVGAQTMADFIDASAGTFTDKFIKGPGGSIDGNFNFTGGTIVSSTNATGTVSTQNYGINTFVANNQIGNTYSVGSILGNTNLLQATTSINNSSVVGNVNAGLFTAALTAPTGNVSGAGYAGLTSVFQATSNDTGTIGAPLSSGSGLISIAELHASAEYFTSLSAATFETEIVAGSTVKNKGGIGIVQLATDVVQGSVVDAAVSLTGLSGSVGWNCAFCLLTGAMNASGTVIGVTNAQTAAYLLDAYNLTLTGGYLRGKLGTYYIDQNFNLAANDVKGVTFHSGATAGVTCSGSPSSSFAAANGIVTHC
jgi:hypothetical protein